ncbi:MAG: hypothetical protein HY017_02750 [Betaproteobacteria bacterium]|nr:hypothetical protein [Betaproteobacteria bacterium]
MRTVYATQIRICPRSGEKTSDVVNSITDKVVNWVMERYSKEGIFPAIDFDAQVREPKPGHRIVACADVVDGHAVIWLDWGYPHEPDTSLLWQTQVLVAVSGDEIEVSIFVRITSAEFMVKPLDYSLGRPRIVPVLLGSFHCRAGGRPLTATPTGLETSEVKSFARDVLLSTERTLPVVIVSPNTWTNKTYVDVGKMQDTLAGLAIVVELKTKWAAFELTDALGRMYSCYNGAVRIYWPGFKLGNDGTLVHHVFLPETIRSNLALHRPLENYLFRMFAPLAAFRSTEGAITRRARAAVEKSKRAQLDELVEKSKQGDTSVDKELLDLALTENQRLEAKALEQEARIAELERDIAGYKENLAGLAEYRPYEERGTDSETQNAEPEPNSVVESLKIVSDKYKDVLTIYKSAWESAEASDFSRPEEILKALIAVADLGKDYFASKKMKTSIGPWEAFFDQHGLKYSSSEHQTR